MATRTSAGFVGALLVAYGAALGVVHAASGAGVRQLKETRESVRGPYTTSSLNAEEHVTIPLKVLNVRIEDSSLALDSPSATLKFNVSNQSHERLTDIIVEVSIVEKVYDDRQIARTLVRPFKIRGSVVLEAGYTLGYELVLRNLRSDCECLANVDVVSFRSLAPVER